MRDPRSQKRDLGHPSISPFDLAEGASFVISLPTRLSESAAPRDDKERVTVPLRADAAFRQLPSMERFPLPLSSRSRGICSSANIAWKRVSLLHADLSSRPEESWACGPPNIIKNASVRHPLSIEPLPFPCHPDRSGGTCGSCGRFLDMFFDRAYPDFLPRSTGNDRACAFL